MKKSILIILVSTFLIYLTACNGEQKNYDSVSTEQSIPSSSAVQTQEETTAEMSSAATEESMESTIDHVIEIDLSRFFDGINGCAVFYNPQMSEYNIYNVELSDYASSPCSTFKIISSLIGLEEGVIDPDNSTFEWSGEEFWKKDWNRDINFEQAFQASCVWYFRQVTDRIGKVAMESYLSELGYGNCDISDWEGILNTNNNNRALTGFWIESSLKISPKEQTDVMRAIFENHGRYSESSIARLKQVMLVEQENRAEPIFGKTGMGVKDGKTIDAWFVGMFERDGQPNYFAVRLDDPEKTETSSKKAKEIAIRIITESFSE